MTEQKIEKIIMDKVEAALKNVGLDNVQVIGAWQVCEDLKGLEDRLSDGVVGVKVSPRTYETPTVPDGQFAVDLTLTIRSDVDADGQLYLEATQAVSQMIHNWQKCQARVEADFSLGGEFVPTGFQITDGDCGLDRENVIWQYSQSFALYGIIT